MLLFVVVSLVFYVSALFKPGAYDTLFPFAPVQGYLLALFLMAIKGPMEEIGWRGLALPLLQRSMSPIWAAVVLASSWGIWHLPAVVQGGCHTEVSAAW